MKIPNGFFGNGPGRDEQNTRDQEAYMRNRMQMTVATSTFAGVALVGMFCSCIWFACCRNSSSKTRKKARTWASANPEAAAQNPYTYDGHTDSHGYMQMNNNNDGVAPYMNPPCSMYGENGLTNAYDFNDHFGFNQGGKAQMSTLFGGPTSAYAAPVLGGTNDTNLKDVPPSYTALFFAASDPSNGIPGRVVAGSSTNGDSQSITTDPRVTSIQPIHLKVTSSTEDQKQNGSDQTKASTNKRYHGKCPSNLEEEDMDDDFLNMRHDRSAAPVSLMSVESDSGKEFYGENQEKKWSNNEKSIFEETREKPPPYNPGYNGEYNKF